MTFIAVTANATERKQQIHQFTHLYTSNYNHFTSSSSSSSSSAGNSMIQIN